ncbi:MAG: hypothetical protein ACE5HJ_01925 [Thermoplasmata archaeon]
MIILVNGLLGFSAGKTSVVRAILQRALEEGEDFLAFKPKSAHNYWEHFDHSKMCESLGTLVSRDALVLRELCLEPPAVELMNPYHQLICPLDLMKAQNVGEHLLEGGHDLILAERLTDSRGVSTLFVNRRADIFVAPSSFMAALRRKAQRVQTFQTSPVAEGMAPVEECVRSTFAGLAGARSNLVVESFSDTALPLELSGEEMDLVVSVGGSLVLLFEPREVAKAIRVVKSQTMADILRYIRPIATFRVPHLTSGERAEGDTLVRSYDEVLRAIWERF